MFLQDGPLPGEGLSREECLDAANIIANDARVLPAGCDFIPPPLPLEAWIAYGGVGFAVVFLLYLFVSGCVRDVRAAIRSASP